MFDAIVRNSGAKFDVLEHRMEVAAASLLHDLGHGPFSHSIEEALHALGTQFHHEDMTVRILLEDPEISGILSQVGADFPLRVASYIDKSKRNDDRWTYRLISSQLDADRLDYVVRDARMAGIVGHGFDVPRLLDMLRVWEGVRVVVDRHATEAVEAYLLTLMHLYRVVYFHRAVRGATVLLTSVLRRAAYLHKEGDGSVFPASAQGGVSSNPFRSLVDEGSDVDVAEYLRLGEFHVWQLIEEWQTNHDRILSDLATRLMLRQRFRAADLPGSGQKFIRCSREAPKVIAQTLGFLSEEEANTYYFVGDDPQRVGYKGYRWTVEKGSSLQRDESIWLASDRAEPVAVENETDNGIFQALRQTHISDRLMFPHEVEDQIAELLS